MSAENKAIVRRYFEEVFNKSNLAAVEEFVAPNFVGRDPTFPEIRGIEGLKQFLTTFRASFPDMQMTLGDIVAEGDKVVAQWTFRGTHRGEFIGIAPTDKELTVTGIDIISVSGGKIAEIWANFDSLGMIQQLRDVPK